MYVCLLRGSTQMSCQSTTWFHWSPNEADWCHLGWINPHFREHPWLAEDRRRQGIKGWEKQQTCSDSLLKMFGLMLWWSVWDVFSFSKTFFFFFLSAQSTSVVRLSSLSTLPTILSCNCFKSTKSKKISSSVCLLVSSEQSKVGHLKELIIS